MGLVDADFAIVMKGEEALLGVDFAFACPLLVACFFERLVGVLGFFLFLAAAEVFFLADELR